MRLSWSQSMLGTWCAKGEESWRKKEYHKSEFGVRERMKFPVTTTRLEIYSLNKLLKNSTIVQFDFDQRPCMENPFVVAYFTMPSSLSTISLTWAISCDYSLPKEKHFFLPQFIRHGKYFTLKYTVAIPTSENHVTHFLSSLSELIYQRPQPVGQECSHTRLFNFKGALKEGANLLKHVHREEDERKKSL